MRIAFGHVSADGALTSEHLLEPPPGGSVMVATGTYRIYFKGGFDAVPSVSVAFTCDGVDDEPDRQELFALVNASEHYCIVNVYGGTDATHSHGHACNAPFSLIAIARDHAR